MSLTEIFENNISLQHFMNFFTEKVTVYDDIKIIVKSLFRCVNLSFIVELPFMNMYIFN